MSGCLAQGREKEETEIEAAPRRGGHPPGRRRRRGAANNDSDSDSNTNDNNNNDNDHNDINDVIIDNTNTHNDT